jgi:ABC-type multidrug transport system fused ATPase/permease subunit
VSKRRPVVSLTEVSVSLLCTLFLVGGGKSTCANLIQKFYVPSSGAITLDGYNMASLDPDFLHSIVGVVNQEPSTCHACM